MNTSTILLLITVIVIGGGLIWWAASEPAEEPEVSSVAPEEATLGDNTPPTEDDQPASASDDTAPAEAAAVVRHTAGGFVPESVTIEAGETVQFVNESSSAMWVASNEHPTHTLYSDTSRSEHCASGSTVDAFDQCETGNIYSFTFQQSGSWDYHNHLNPSAAGTVVVE